MEDTITNIKTKRRKSRHTFPDEYSSNSVKHKRRHSFYIAMEDEFDSYNEKRVIIKKNADGVKKEIIIKKYTKVHPLVEDEITENNSDKSRENDKSGEDDKKVNNYTKVLDILYKIVLKIMCYTGILSCIAI
jgi:hypothetical protein